MEKQTFGDITLYCGDFMEALDHIPPVDLVLCDAAYRKESGGTTANKSGLMSGKFSGTNYNNDGEMIPVLYDWAEFIGPLVSVMAENSEIILMTDGRNYGLCDAALRAAGLRFHNILIWDKMRPTPNRNFMQRVEFAAYYFKGRTRNINDCGLSNVFCVKPVRESYCNHPNEKPVRLMEDWILACTDAGGLVFDPMMGSGTTLVAAAKTKRRAVGCELLPENFDMACNRVEEALTGKSSALPLFANEGKERVSAYVG